MAEGQCAFLAGGKMWWLTMIEAHGDSEAPLGRILVVEDEPPIRELVRLHLSLAGFEVEEIGDGTVALERARSARFDLIVLDLMLPGLDGITLCRAIRARGANTATPILMVTARDTEADKVLGLESGADDYLAKPFGVRELVSSSGRCCDATNPDGANRKHRVPCLCSHATSSWTPTGVRCSSGAHLSR